jgi:predicted enzyme related to lactoylglutathione lyase
MKTHVWFGLGFALALSACAAKPVVAPAPATPAPTPAPHGLQIKLTTIFVDDQDKALAFYTDVVGFAKKDDVTNGPYRWLTVSDGDGTLQLAPLMDPAAKAFHEAEHAQHAPVAMFFTDDVQADYDRIKAKGGQFMMPPNDIGFAKITILDDTVGNYVQLTQLAK